MSAITINLSEERMQRLREVASRLGVSPEDLARTSVEELLARPDDQGGPPVRRTNRFGNGHASTAVQGSLVLGRPSEKARRIRSAQSSHSPTSKARPSTTV